MSGKRHREPRRSRAAGRGDPVIFIAVHGIASAELSSALPTASQRQAFGTSDVKILFFVAIYSVAFCSLTLYMNFCQMKSPDG